MVITPSPQNLAAGANPIILRRGMKKATESAVDAISKMSQKVNGKEHIARVAAISAGDEEVGQLVADAMEKVSGAFAMVTPSFVIRGAPKDLSSTTFLPLGPRVTLTVSDS